MPLAKEDFSGAPISAPSAFAIALGALAIATTPASAAECLNGYQTLGNDVIALRDPGIDLSERNASFPQPAPEVDAPAVTGATRPNSMMVDDRADCAPGLYRMVEWEDANVILACGN